MNAEQTRRAEKYSESGTERYEFTGILTELLVPS